MIAVGLILVTLVLGLRYPGALLAAVFFGYTATIISGIGLTTPVTGIVVFIVMMQHFLRKLPLTLNSLDFAFLAFLFIYTGSTLWAMNTNAGLSATINLLLPSLSVYFTAKFTYDQGDPERRAFETIVAMLCLSVAMTALLQASGDTASGRLKLDGLGNVAVGVTQAFVTAGIASLVLFFRPGRMHFLLRALAVVAFSASLYGISLSGTRGGFVGMMAGIVFLLGLFLANSGAWRIRLRWSTLLIVAGAAVAAVLVVDWTAFLDSRIFSFSTYGSEVDPSSVARRLRYAVAFEMISDKPILGSGISTYAYATGLGYPHNVFLEVGVTAGLVGILMFLLFIFGAFRSAFLIRRRHSVYFLAFVVAVFFAGLIQHQISFALPGGKQLFFAGAISGYMAALRTHRRRRVQRETAHAGGFETNAIAAGGGQAL